MNAHYIYDIFETCEKNDIPDLTIALAHLQTTKPLPEGLTEDQVNKFIGRHYDELAAAYQTHDRDVFAEVVAIAEQEDAALAEPEGSEA